MGAVKTDGVAHCGSEVNQLAGYTDRACVLLLKVRVNAYRSVIWSPLPALCARGGDGIVFRPITTCTFNFIKPF